LILRNISKTWMLLRERKKNYYRAPKFETFGSRKKSAQSNPSCVSTTNKPFQEKVNKHHEFSVAIW